MKKLASEKVYKEFFCIPKNDKLSDKVFGCRMAVSLLSILVCLTVMVSSTLALFYMDVRTKFSTIQSAYYSVTVNGEAPGSTYTCPLALDDRHTFAIEADGTATTGYCVVEVGGDVYYTEPIPQDSSLTLTVQAAKGVEITITPQWGLIPATYGHRSNMAADEIIHSRTPYVTYEVADGAELDAIAEHYGVSVSDIKVYNGINELIPGMTLKIPGVEGDIAAYQVPAAEELPVPVEPPVTPEENVTGNIEGEADIPAVDGEDDSQADPESNMGDATGDDTDTDLGDDAGDDADTGSDDVAGDDADTGSDGSTESGSDGGSDGSTESGSDSSSDDGTDSGSDSGSDGSTDSGTDSSSDDSADSDSGDVTE